MKFIEFNNSLVLTALKERGGDNPPLPPKKEKMPPRFHPQEEVKQKINLSLFRSLVVIMATAGDDWLKAVLHMRTRSSECQRAFSRKQCKETRRKGYRKSFLGRNASASSLKEGRKVRTRPQRRRFLEAEGKVHGHFREEKPKDFQDEVCIYTFSTSNDRGKMLVYIEKSWFFCFFCFLSFFLSFSFFLLQMRSATFMGISSMRVL